MLIRLKELRKINKIKQKDFSKILGITAATYNRYELGIIYPSLDKLILLADFYKVSLDYLVMRTDYCSTQNKDQCQEQDKLRYKYDLLDIRGRRIVDTILDHEYQIAIQHLHKNLNEKSINEQADKSE